jgi:hypothetical protein
MRKVMAKDNWDKFEIWIKLITAISVVCVPIVIGIYGNFINNSIKAKELQQQSEQHNADLSQKYVEIAVGILNNRPLPETKPLRTWAIDTINKYSEIKLTEVQKKILIEKQLSNNASPSLTGVGGKGGVGNLSASGSKVEDKINIIKNATVELKGVGGQGAAH